MPSLDTGKRPTNSTSCNEGTDAAHLIDGAHGQSLWERLDKGGIKALEEGQSLGRGVDVVRAGPDSVAVALDGPVLARWGRSVSAGVAPHEYGEVHDVMELAVRGPDPPWVDGEVAHASRAQGLLEDLDAYFWGTVGQRMRGREERGKNMDSPHFDSDNSEGPKRDRRHPGTAVPTTPPLPPTSAALSNSVPRFDAQSFHPPRTKTCTCPDGYRPRLALSYGKDPQGIEISFPVP